MSVTTIKLKMKTLMSCLKQNQCNSVINFFLEYGIQVK